MKSFFVTFDTDWVHECAVEYVVELLNKYNVQGTFFATGRYECLLREKDCHESGIHPNFNPILEGKGGSLYEAIDSLLEIYPQSVGIRSHSLTQSSQILAYSFQKGILYDSNQYNPNGGIPYKDYSGLMRFVHNYVDLGHLIDRTELTIENMNINQEMINIFDFHPIHIYLNSPNLEFYQSIKHLTTSKQSLNSSRNKKVRGIGDLFVEILVYMQANNISGGTLKNLL